MDQQQNANQGFDRLQRVLLGMRAGDEMRAAEASTLCGLSQDVCLTVLEGLERVGLMRRHGDGLFVRKTLEHWTTESEPGVPESTRGPGGAR